MDSVPTEHGSMGRMGLARGLAPIVALVALHLLFLACFFAPAISTPDANGYFAQARLIARQGRSDIAVESPAQYVGDHWMPTGPGRYFGQYPPGLPALLAVAFRLGGPEASLWVIPVMGSLTLLALYLVVRAWVGPGWALLAAVLMALNPVANYHALGADSHTAICFFLMWGLYGLVRWERTRSAGWAALTGFCLGMIPTIRYPEAIFMLAFAYYVMQTWRRADGLGALAAGALGAAVPVVALAARNQAAFGAFWRTGYSISGEQTGFGLGYFALHVVPYLVLMLTIGAGLVLVVGVRGLYVFWKQPEPELRLRARFLVALVLPITLLYMAYYWHADTHSLRFLLPTSFVYTIAAVAFLQTISQADPPRGRKLARILLAVTVVWGLPLSLFKLWPLERDNAALADVSRALRRHVEPGSILIAQSGLQQHLDFLGDWRLAPEEALEGRTRPPRPMGPGPRDDGPEPPRPSSSSNSNEQAHTFLQEVSRWSGGRRKVYWMTTPARLRSVSTRLGLEGNDPWVKVAEIRIAGPRRPDDRDRDRRADGPDPDRPPPPRWLRWWGPPPPLPGPDGGPGPRRRGPGPGPGGPPGGGPAHFEPPADGTFVLVEWKPREG